MNPPNDERFSTSQEDVKRAAKRRQALLSWAIIALVLALLIGAVFYAVNS